MANNRMYLVHRPTGNCVYFGKRMASGWYGTPDNLTETMLQFFEACSPENPNTPKEGYELYDQQDDFMLAMEDAEHAPHANGDWHYLGEPPNGKIFPGPYPKLAKEAK